MEKISEKLIKGSTSGSKRPSMTTRQSNKRRRGSTREIVEIQDTDKEVRTLITETTFSTSFLEDHGLGEIMEALSYQGWENLFNENVYVNEETVRKFYRTLTVEERKGLILATFEIDEETRVITDRDLARILNVPTEGYAEYVKGTWPPSVAKAEVILRVGEDPTNISNQGSVLSMGIINRILHRLVCSTITPRKKKHGVVSFQDFLLVDKLRRKEKISLPKIILLHMKHCISSESHGLPYPGLIKKILIEIGCYREDNEISASVTLDLKAFEKLSWTYNPSSGWSNPRNSKNITETEPQTPCALAGTSHGTGSQQHEDMSAVMDKIEILTTKVSGLEKLLENLIQGKDVKWVEQIEATAATTNKLPTLIKEVDETAGMTITHSLFIKDQILELNKHLKFIATTVMDQLKTMFKWTGRTSRT